MVWFYWGNIEKKHEKWFVLLLNHININCHISNNHIVEKNIFQNKIRLFIWKSYKNMMANRRRLNTKGFKEIHKLIENDWAYLPKIMYLSMMQNVTFGSLRPLLPLSKGPPKLIKNRQSSCVTLSLRAKKYVSILAPRAPFAPLKSPPPS